MNKPPFKQAKQKDMYDLQEGDVVAYQDEKDKKWKRGLVYSLLAHPRRPDELIGYKLLPVVTIGRKKDADSTFRNLPYEKMENDNATIVSKAGGTPGLHRSVVFLNIVKVRNIEPIYNAKGQMIDGFGKETTWVLGDHTDSNYVGQFQHAVRDAYLAGKLYSDGQLVPPGAKIRIIDPKHAIARAKSARILRHDTLKGLERENRTSGTVSFEEIARSQPAKKKAEARAPQAAVPPMAQHFEKARQYDVRLKDLFLMVNAGGERLAIVRMLGTTPDGIEPDDNMPSVIDASKKRTSLTLRDAVKFIDEKGSAAEVAKVLQQSGSISAASAEKAITKLKEIHDALGKVVTVDGKPSSSHEIISHLISNNKLEVAGP